MHSIDRGNSDVNIGRAMQGGLDRNCGCEYDEVREEGGDGGFW